jgi:probable F420-dependent oxidoreductase
VADRSGGGFVRLGISTFPTEDNIDVRTLGQALEERGFESLFVPEHTHIPVSRRSPFPGGGELPKRYSHTHDPFVGLAFAAAATKKLLVGTGICLVPQHEPIVTAKAIATLDQLSGGRFVFGIGGGWNVDEMENHGARYDTRFKMMREYVLAMKALWTEEEASFHGEFVNFDPAWSWPKPKQRPHPPIILGGESDHTLRRVIDYCDGWFPRPRGGFDVVQGVERLHRMATEKGRNPTTLTTIVFGAPNDAKVLEGYEKAGIPSALLAIPDDSRDEILRYLDKIAPLAKVGVPA